MKTANYLFLLLFSIFTFHSNAQLGQNYTWTFVPSSTGIKYPLSNGDMAGILGYKVWTGTNYETAVRLYTRASGNHSSGYFPTSFIVQTGITELQDRVTVLANGNVGFNISNPQARVAVKQYFNPQIPFNPAFEVIGGVADSLQKKFRLFTNPYLPHPFTATMDGNMFIREGELIVEDGNLQVQQGDLGIFQGDINVTNGNVGIGVANMPGNHRLFVGGSVVCEELKIAFSQDWPDYVFYDEYSLMPLEQIRKFTQQHKHLPQIPPATKIEKEGLNVGEMTVLQQQTIEEIYLHLFDLNEKIKKLEKENKVLKSMIQK